MPVSVRYLIRSVTSQWPSCYPLRYQMHSLNSNRVILQSDGCIVSCFTEHVSRVRHIYGWREVISELINGNLVRKILDCWKCVLDFLHTSSGWVQKRCTKRARSCSTISSISYQCWSGFLQHQMDQSASGWKPYFVVLFSSPVLAMLFCINKLNNNLSG